MAKFSILFLCIHSLSLSFLKIMWIQSLRNKTDSTYNIKQSVFVLSEKNQCILSEKNQCILYEYNDYIYYFEEKNFRSAVSACILYFLLFINLLLLSNPTHCSFLHLHLSYVDICGLKVKK